MGSLELDSYVRRLAALRETSPPTSRSETIAWVIWPLLSELEWKHELTQPGSVIGLTGSDQVLSVGTEPPTPALIAAGESHADSLSDDRIESIAAVMDRTGIDRAIYTNGTEFLFLAGTGDDQLRLSASDLSTRESDVGLYNNGRLRERCHDLDQAERMERRLAVFQDDLATAITTLLETKLGPAASPARQSIDAFLDVLSERTRKSPSASEASDAGPESTADSPETTALSEESDRSDIADGSAQSASEGESDPGEQDASTPPSIRPEDNPEGEFVVRIFNERGSIGAVGHSTSAGALVEAATYFFDRGLSGIRVPWAPDDGPIVVNEKPVDGDGRRWTAYEQLPNGLFVNTSGSVAERADRVEALADRAGLRVMLTGDWDRLMS